MLLALVLMTSILATEAPTQSPYAGEETRAIKALSDSEVGAYLAGSGMGYAKAAELNRYPGPKHVLELAEELDLSAAQLASTNRLFEEMKLDATRLGEKLVAKERELDQLFASAAVTPATLRQLTAEISRLEGEIRFAHLNAHLAQKAILSEHQARRYDALRGYGDGHKHHH